MSRTPPEAETSARRAFARKVLEMEARAISNVAHLLADDFDRAVDLLLTCSGRVVVTGIGKAGLIGNKLSATLASTGTPSFFLHPSEASHGDLGRVRREDVVMLLSSSGESDEVVQLVDPLRRIGASLVALCGSRLSTLGRNAAVVLDFGQPPEACPLGLAPTASTAAMLAMGDALAMTLVKERGFNTEDFARFHPGGALGRRLMTVGEIMRRGERVTVVARDVLTREALLAINQTPGRPGAAMVVDGSGRLAGFFTDGDLARRLQQETAFLDRPIHEVMSPDPISVDQETLAADAFRILRERRVDQLPVVDGGRRPVGLLDVQDLLDARIV